MLHFVIFTDGPISSADSERAYRALQTRLRQLRDAAPSDDATVTLDSMEFTRLVQLGIRTGPVEVEGAVQPSDRVLQGTTSESKKRKVANGSPCKSIDDRPDSGDDENPFVFRGNPAVPGPSDPRIVRHMKKKKMTPVAMTGERAHKAEPSSNALRQRDAAGLAVSTVCPDVVRLCTKLSKQDPALKVRHPSRVCSMAARLAPARSIQVLGITTTRAGFACIATAAMNSVSLDLLLDTLIEYPGNIQ